MVVSQIVAAATLSAETPSPAAPDRLGMEGLGFGVFATIEPLDTESAMESGQRLINHEFVNFDPKRCSKGPQDAATRGESVSREQGNPKTESVKKNLVIESCESIVESFLRSGAIMLRASAGLFDQAATELGVVTDLACAAISPAS
ncbi:MAG: hypothetical protein AAF687_09435 [Pseudomonadota bacterium]